jgi:hypothetical protein
MTKRTANITLYLSMPTIGSEIRALVRELAHLTGVASIVPIVRSGRLLLIGYDPAVVAAETLVQRARRSWRAAQLVGTVS